MNIKALEDRRDELLNGMQTVIDTAVNESRALTDEEIAAQENDMKEVDRINATIVAARNMERAAVTESRSAAGVAADDAAAREERAFLDYVRGIRTEMRTGEQNLTMANAAAIIPTSIANRIITAVVDRCPILRGATRYNVRGNLKVPVWGNANSTHNIAVGYQTEFTEITADSGAFTSVDLGGYLAGALTLIGRSVINSATFDVVGFIVDQMSEAIATWIEGQLLVGTGSSAAQGATATSNTMTAASATAVTADELIDLQAKVKQVFQRNACWTMAPATFTAIKKLKDANNRYLLQDDVTQEFPYRLLGKPVYLSDNMPAMAASANAILYGEYAGLSVNFRENIGIQVLREHYATQHAVGVLGWFEFDSKVTDSQRLAVLKMGAGG